MVLDIWFLPGARPASSMTRIPINGGEVVAIKVGTASWMLLPAHGRELLFAHKAGSAQARDSALALSGKVP